MIYKRQSLPISALHIKFRLLVSTTSSEILTQPNQNDPKHDPPQKIETAFPSSRLIRASMSSHEQTHLDNWYLTHSFCSNALKISAKKGFLPEGKQLHAHTVKLGFNNVLSLQNQILYIYVKCNVFHDASKLFDEMLVRNVVTWNTLLDFWRFKSNSHMGFQYFKRMLSEMVAPDYVTFLTLLRICVELMGIEIGRQLHCFILKLGLYKDSFVNSALVDMYAKLGFVGDARRVFDAILKKDIVLWNVMMSCYALNCLTREAFEVYQGMHLEGVKGDDFTFTNLLKSCGNLGFCKLGRQIHDVVIRLSFDLDVVVASALVDMYAKNEQILDARKTFEGIIYKNVISWNTMIVAYGQCCDEKEAMKLFREMFRENFGPDELTLASIFSSCGNSSSTTDIVQVHAYAIKTGFQNFLSTMNSLIVAYSECGSIASTLKCFSSIKEPDLVSWTSMIRAYAFHGVPKEGIILFEKMLVNNVSPDRVTFLSLLAACSHGGLVCEGLHYFNLMTFNYHIVPSSEHYACLIDLLGRAGHLTEAFNVLTSMPMGPGSDALGAFMGACKVHGNAYLAKWAAEKLFELEPNKPVNYMLMSNIYASSGCWSNVARVRKMMRERCDYKVPGYSWVEVSGEVHTFVSSDKSHMRTVEVYDLLEMLARLMEEDYVYNMDFMSDNVEDEYATDFPT